MNKLSKIFHPVTVVPKNALVKNNDITSKSQKLMLDLGLIKPAGNGTFHLLPLLQKSLEKCIHLIDNSMKEIDGQKMTLPILTSADLWKKSGRLETASAELMTTKDRHGKLQILSPTHEESITSLIGNLSPISYRQFPLRLYQIGVKFRDEIKPRFGLMRAKEFIMKDLYTFDLNKEDSVETYDKVNNAYIKLFNKINIPFVKVCGDTGTIGGTTSHEYHIPSIIGEDNLFFCGKCNYSINYELCGDINECPNCNDNSINKSQGIEIAHTFLLDDKYSRKLGANYLHKNGKTETLLMGCYGIGVSRLLAASIENLSTENEIVWPFLLAPFNICLITPKEGSKKVTQCKHLTEKMFRDLIKIPFINSEAIVIDDRSNLTIGKRLHDAKRIGYSLIIIIGQKSTIINNEIYELYNTMDKQLYEFNYNDLLINIKEIFFNKNSN